MSGDPRVIAQLAAVKRAVAALEAIIALPDQQPRLLQVKEVARLLGRHPRTARRLMKLSGRAETIRGRLYLNQADLLKISPTAAERWQR